MNKRNDSDRDVSKFIADSIVLILFFVLLASMTVFACLFYFFLWLLGIV